MFLVGARPDWRNRILFYWGKMYTSQLQKGQTYADLKPSIIISILDFNIFMDEIVHRSCHLVDDATGETLTDLIELYFLELNKLKKFHSEPNDSSHIDSLKEWMLFLNANKRSEMRMLSEHNEYIMKAYEELDRLSLDPKARMLYEAREKELLDTLSSIEYGIQEGWNRAVQLGIDQGIKQGIELGIDQGIKQGVELGIDQGIKQGVEQSAIQIAAKLKAAGSSIDFIAATTGLSIDKIQSL